MREGSSVSEQKEERKGANRSASTVGRFGAFASEVHYILLHLSFEQVEKLADVLILFTSFMFAFSLVAIGLDYDDLNAADVKLCSAQNLTLYDDCPAVSAILSNCSVISSFF